MLTLYDDAFLIFFLIVNRCLWSTSKSINLFGEFLRQLESESACDMYDDVTLIISFKGNDVDEVMSLEARHFSIKRQIRARRYAFSFINSHLIV